MAADTPLTRSGSTVRQTAREVEDEEPAPSVLEPALELYDAGLYEEALLMCGEIAKAAPGTPGLPALRQRSMEALWEQRTLNALQLDEINRQRMAVESLEARDLPDTYRTRRFSEDMSEAFFEEPPLSRVLDRPVTINLQGANLGTFIETLAQDEEINMIADQGLAADKEINIAVSDVPLREVFDFIARNYDVRFYLGENIIWVSAPVDERLPPMQTRIFKLRKGLQHYGDDWGKTDSPVGGDMGMISRHAGTLPEGQTHIEKVIRKFVPEAPGAQLHVDRSTHTLIARDTVDNLKLINQMIEVLDASPPQVLIEARFLEVSVSDLREIGLEWELESAVTTTRKAVMRNGQLVQEPRTQVDPGASVSYIPYTSDDGGVFPLGPQGSFGSTRDSNPPTDDQGLNLTYRGVLTEPMYEAVLHMIEISGKGRTLSVPRVTTANNHPAKLRDGEDLLFFKQFRAQAFQLREGRTNYTVTALVPHGAPDSAELGITLVAVPSVGADMRSINLLLTPTISRLDRFESYQETGTMEPDRPQQQVQQVMVRLPVINRREIQTKVIVESGETVVLGGLIRSVEQKTVHRVPILGSLPLVGQLFRRSAVTEEKQNLLVFVTATVITERGENLIPVR